MRVLGYAIADEMPPPGAKGRKARLPDLAVALARRAVGDREVPEETAVEFGTAFGSLTETESFVENMIRAREETPKPRHFSASVHNAMASRVAMALGAKGPCRTFVHGELSFLQAVRSARRSRFALVGALDERTPYVDRAREVCGKGAGGDHVPIPLEDVGRGTAVEAPVVERRGRARIAGRRGEAAALAPHAPDRVVVAEAIDLARVVPLERIEDLRRAVAAEVVDEHDVVDEVRDGPHRRIQELLLVPHPHHGGDASRLTQQRGAQAQPRRDATQPA